MTFGLDHLNSTTALSAITTLPRPPTPPRQLPRVNCPSTTVTPLPPNHSLAATTKTPFSSSADSASERPKTVKWTTELATIAVHDPDSGVPITPSRRIPASATSTPRSLKSILKPSQPIPPSPEQIPWAPMLQSFIEALEGSDRGSKLDHYIMFCNALKSYDDVPDINLLVAKIPALVVYLKRDMEARFDDSDRPDNQIIQQAIKLFSVIIWDPRLVEAVDERSLLWFIQRIIESLEDPSSTKATITIDLHILGSNRLSHKLMNSERINRIISVLEILDTRVQGKSIAKNRLSVYIRLLAVGKQVMQARAIDWMHIMFRGLLSKEQDLRLKALELLKIVASVMSEERAISRAILSIFNRPFNGDRLFGEIQRRLEHLVTDEKEGVFVAQVWSAIVLLLRGRSHGEYATPWLRIIQTCFNSSDQATKLQAQIAWSKFIYSIFVPGLERKKLELLCRPLEAFADPKTSPHVQKAILANIMLLLYYGIRPNATTQQLSDIWGTVVVRLVEKLIRTHSVGAGVLVALLSNDVRLWNEKRALLGPTLHSDEIPRVDPRWVRSHCSVVLKTVESSIWRTTWSGTSNISSRTIWSAFMKTLADAGAKEVKISLEHAGAVAELTEFFERLWTSGTSTSDQFSCPDTNFVEVFCFLLGTTWDSLGTLSFIERPSHQDRLRTSPVSTPSRKTAVASAPANTLSPIVRIFKLFLHPARGTVANDDYYDHVKNMMYMLVSSLRSTRKKLSLLALMAGSLSEVGTVVELHIWDMLASLVSLALPTVSSGEANRMDSDSMNSDFLDTLAVLKWGLIRPVSTWDRLFDDLAHIIRQECGIHVLTASYIEPLAELLRHHIPQIDRTITLNRSTCLFQQADYPETQNQTGGMMVRVDGLHAPVECPVPRLVELGSSLLELDLSSCTDSLRLINAMIDFLSRIPSNTVGPLRDFQHGLALWFRQVAQDISPKNKKPGFSNDTIASAWSRCIQLLHRLPNHNNVTLSDFAALFSCGFDSSIHQVVKSTLSTWNHTFAKQNCLQYPDCVQASLLKLKESVEMPAPTLPDMDDEVMKTDRVLSPNPRKYRCTHDGISPRQGYSQSPIVQETPYPSRISKSLGRISPASKAKHLDSQVEFVPIVQGNDETQDSQRLTEHQKDVHNRQIRAAQLFSDIGSSLSDLKDGVPATHAPKSADKNLTGPTSTSRSPIQSRTTQADLESSKHIKVKDIEPSSITTTTAPSRAISEDAELQETFVDAQDHIPGDDAPSNSVPRASSLTPHISDESAASCPRDETDILVEIPRISLGTQCQHLRFNSQHLGDQSESGQQTPVMADDSSVSSTPVRKRSTRSGRKRKRAIADTPDDILETIVVNTKSTSQSAPSSPNRLSVAPGSSNLGMENQRSGKRTKFADLLRSSDLELESTPTRRQRRTGKKPRTPGKSPYPPTFGKADGVSFIRETQVDPPPTVKERSKKTSVTGDNESQHSTPSRRGRSSRLVMSKMVLPSVSPSQTVVPSGEQTFKVNDTPKPVIQLCFFFPSKHTLAACPGINTDTKLRIQTSGQVPNGSTEKPDDSPNGKALSAEAAILAFRQAMRLVEQVDMSPRDLESIEDEMFSAFAQLRKRRKLMS
ncbi:hypothetical protein EX30DRAFT_340203 [Ascodesmis nigricans]|uniref:Telomere-associated protein Rif1 N-terminal domain-containing protein n=1 Tax=Ascodesmis nigricans TaxID=341454 RepID=A0A4S2MYJ8_9PEZI|nr:hypothetical protein EX30DRAFT_340203 [Ascodesmis nigricans]